VLRTAYEVGARKAASEFQVKTALPLAYALPLAGLGTGAFHGSQGLPFGGEAPVGAVAGGMYGLAGGLGAGIGSTLGRSGLGRAAKGLGGGVLGLAALKAYLERDRLPESVRGMLPA